MPSGGSKPGHIKNKEAWKQSISRGLALSNKKIGKPRAMTAQEFKQAAEQWMQLCETKTIQVEIPKTNMKTGEAIRMTKPIPPLIESFCLSNKISNSRFLRYQRESGFEAYQSTARKIIDFCTTKILEYTALGIISDRVGIFYMVNNSRYADVSKVEHEVTDKELPGWLKSNKAIEEQKKLPGESIDFEDVE